MTGQNRNHVVSHAVHADDCRVGVLVLDKRSYCAHTDAHGTNKDEGIILVPVFTDIGTGHGSGL